MQTALANQYPPFSCLQMLAVGGNWWERDALDISNGQHAELTMSSVARTVLAFCNSGTDVAMRIDDTSGDTINLNNDYVLERSKLWCIWVPLDIQIRPIIHFKQLTSDPTGEVRIVER